MPSPIKMEERSKLKNLYDLEYHTKLSYLNIIVITLITSFITIILSVYKQSSIFAIISFSLLLILSLTLIILYFHGSFRKIKKKISEL